MASRAAWLMSLVNDGYEDSRREKGNDFEHHSEPSVDRDRGIVGCDFGGEGGVADTRSAVMVALDAGTAG